MMGMYGQGWQCHITKLSEYGQGWQRIVTKIVEYGQGWQCRITNIGEYDQGWQCHITNMGEYISPDKARKRVIYPLKTGIYALVRISERTFTRSKFK